MKEKFNGISQEKVEQGQNINVRKIRRRSRAI